MHVSMKLGPFFIMRKKIFCQFDIEIDFLTESCYNDSMNNEIFEQNSIFESCLP